MSFKVFYAWQSDTESRFNRSFIQKAAEKAFNNVESEFEIQERPQLDQATNNKPGMPDIATTILEKIDEASVFLADLTVVGNIESSSRPTPNPNVLFELGYAVRRLGWEYVIPVMNTAYGKPEQQVFDLRGRRFLLYELNQSTDPEKKKLEKDKLVGQILKALKCMFDGKLHAEGENKLKNFINTDNEIDLSDFMKGIADDLEQRLSVENYPNFGSPITAESFEDRLEKYSRDTAQLASLLATGAHWGKKNQWRCWKTCLEKISYLPQLPSGWSNEYEITRCLRLYPALTCFYAAGLGAMIGEKWETLSFLFHKPRIPFENENREPAIALTPWEIMARYKQYYIVGNGRYLRLKACMSIYLYDNLNEIIVSFLGRPIDYADYFDKFEYLIGLSCLKLIESGGLRRDRRDAPVGRFATLDQCPHFLSKIQSEIEKEKSNWPPLKEKVIDCSYEDCKKLMTIYKKEIQLFRNGERYADRPKEYPVR